MKKEVSPALAVVALLVLLVGVEVVYWQKLAPKPALQGAISRDSQAGGGGAARPRASTAGEAGSHWVAVSTVAGATTPGYVDDAGETARFDGPAAVAVGPDDALYVADSRNHAIRVVQPGGRVTTLAGAPGLESVGGYADGVGKAARFSAPAGVAVLPDGSVLVADTGNHRIRRISRDGLVSTLAGSDTPKDGFGQATGGYRDGPAAQAQFRFPVGVAAGTDGVIYIADAGNGKVRRLANGVVTTVAAHGGKVALRAPTSVLVDQAGTLWVGDSGGGEQAIWNGPAAGPISPYPLAGDHEFSSVSGMVPLWPADGAVPGGGRAPTGVLVLDAVARCLYLSARSDPQGRPAPPVVVAGEQDATGYQDGPGDRARFGLPAGLALSRDGRTAYLADFGNNCLRAVQPEQGGTGGLPTWR